MEELQLFYENELGGKGFYYLLHQKVKTSPKLFNTNMVLAKINPVESSLNLDNAIVTRGDVRIDMPILLGNVNANFRVLILGLEPRYTDDFYNIMKLENRVFATPFGIDRWFSESKQSIYATAFEEFLSNERLFLFSDFVKEYGVFEPGKKNLNDKNARESFKILFESKYKSILESEIEIFSPNIIIALGKTDISKKIPQSWLDKHNVHIVSHPINGNFNRMKASMRAIL